jgi:hypothetical protein
MTAAEPPRSSRRARARSLPRPGHLALRIQTGWRVRGPCVRRCRWVRVTDVAKCRCQEQLACRAALPSEGLFDALRCRIRTRFRAPGLPVGDQPPIGGLGLFGDARSAWCWAVVAQIGLGLGPVLWRGAPAASSSRRRRPSASGQPRGSQPRRHPGARPAQSPYTPSTSSTRRRGRPAGRTTLMDSRSRRTRASRRGGQLHQRAHSP